MSILAGLQLPAISGAQVWAMAKIGVTAIAIAATLRGDRSTNNTMNVMRLQLQEGTQWHYWSVGIERPANPGVTRKDVQLSLTAMWTALQLLSNLDWENDNNWDKFDTFGRWEKQLGSAVIRMSIWVGTHGPTDGSYRTVHQEYADPTDETTPRIDLENVRGVNLSR